MLWNLLVESVRPYLKLLTGVIVFQLAQSIANLFLPTLNADIIDNGVATGDIGYIWKTGGKWGHTSDWTAGTAFDPARHKADALPAGDDKTLPFYYREWTGPLAYRLTRWGKMPFVPEVDVSVTYTFHAGTPVVMVQSLMEFREGIAVHAVRDAELVFSRHQFDTASTVPLPSIATHRSAPSQATLRGMVPPTLMLCSADALVGCHHFLAAALRLPRLRDWSRVRVIKAAICSRVTFCDGLKAVAEVPLASPEK